MITQVLFAALRFKATGADGKMFPDNVKVLCQSDDGRRDEHRRLDEIVAIGNVADRNVPPGVSITEISSCE